MYQVEVPVGDSAYEGDLVKIYWYFLSIVSVLRKKFPLNVKAQDDYWAQESKATWSYDVW